MCLGKFLLNAVFHYCIFFNEVVGVFLLVEFAMGTNCALAWAQLILRMLEPRNPLCNSSRFSISLMMAYYFILS